jgi:hypothetical protein
MPGGVEYQHVGVVFRVGRILRLLGETGPQAQSHLGTSHNLARFMLFYALVVCLK